MNVPITRRIRLLIIFSFMLAVDVHAQNPYLLSQPHSRRAEKWDHRHNMPFNYSLAYGRAKEAGRNTFPLLRDELYGGVVFSTGTYKYRYVEVADPLFGSTDFDTSFTLSVHTKSGFNFGETRGCFISDVGSSAALLLTYGIEIHLIDWTQSDFNVSGKDHSYGVTSTCAGVPLTIDYKSGAEAVLDRSKRTCFTVGFGVQPTFVYATVGYRGSNYNIRLYPVAKVEYGISTKIMTLKLRASGFFGKFNYLDVDEVAEEFKYQHSEIEVNGGSQFALSLVLMPLAGKWEDAAWYR